MNSLEQSVQEILERNKRVEMDKAWEVSFTRRAFLTILTYVTALLLLWMLHQPQFFLIAIVPAAGYVLSTLSLPWLKKMWVIYFY